MIPDNQKAILRVVVEYGSQRFEVNTEIDLSAESEIIVMGSLQPLGAMVLSAAKEGTHQ